MKQLNIIEEIDKKSSIFSPLFSEDIVLPSSFKKNKDGSVLYSTHPDLLNWIIVTNPMTLKDVKLKSSFDINLPEYIPNVDISDKNILRNFAGSFISLSVAGVLERIRSKNSLFNIHETLGIDPSVNLILRFFAKDSRLEEVSSQTLKLIESLIKLDVQVFTSPNFSVVLNRPIQENIINVKRSLIFARQLSDRGAVVIPHIFWGSMPHMKMLADWINEGDSNIRVVIVDLGEGGGSFFEKQLIGLRCFREILNPSKQIIISGPGKLGKIIKLKQAIGKFTLIESTAARYSKIGLPLELKENKIVIGNMSSLEKSQVFDQNIDLFNRIMSEEMVSQNGYTSSRWSNTSNVLFRNLILETME